MSKARKLTRQPGEFFRDFLIKRYPIDFSSKLNWAATPEPRDLFPVEFPIDVVYTWVDPTDQRWQRQREHWAPQANLTGLIEHPNDAARFRDHAELKYSLRSIWQFAPWLRHIFIVTCGQRPLWLTPHPKISFIDHAEIIPRDFLPTFNSHVIEAFLAEIPDLSEHFVYFNDDVFLARPAIPELFFTSSGAAKVALSAKPLPSPGPDELATPMDHACRNVASLVHEVYGVTPQWQILHSFHAQTKQSSRECLRLIRSRGREFLANRFRSSSDYNIASFMTHCIGVREKRTVLADYRCMYFGHANRGANFRYAALLDLRRSSLCPDTFCVNDAPGTEGQSQTSDTELMCFLARYFETTAPWEVTHSL